MQKGECIGLGNTAEVFAWGEGRVVKLYREGVAPEYCANEYAVIKALDGVLPLVPKAYEMVEIEGRTGAVYARINGPTLLEEMTQKPWQAAAAAKTMARCHVELQQPVKALPVPDIKERLAACIDSTDALDAKLKARVLQKLQGLPDGDALCHYDLQPHNMMREGKQVYIIDWANACTGHPHADACRSLVLCNYSELPGATPQVQKLLGQFRKRVGPAYLKEYCRLTKAKEADIYKWELPVIAARLAENPPEAERRALLGRLVEKIT